MDYRPELRSNTKPRNMFLIGLTLDFIATILMLIVVPKEVYVYSDDFYDYYVTVPTAPYAPIGWGLVLIVAPILAYAIWEFHVARVTARVKRNLNQS